MTIYSLDILLFLFGTSLLWVVAIKTIHPTNFLILFFLFLKFVYLFLVVQGLHCCMCVGLSLWCLLLLQSTGFRVLRLQQLWHMGSIVAAPRLQSTGLVVVVQGLSCSKVCGIFLDQRSNPCLLYWQADSLPLSHQGSLQKPCDSS